MRHNQNRRSRGRPNNRKGPNPLTRSYESNGPDVKVRGTAPHVAEKYMSLARDALAAGDNVAAENYLQHAEHYNRIVAAAQLQLQQAQAPQFREGGEEEAEEDRTPRGRDRFGYYTDPEGEEDGFDTGIGDDDGPAQPQQNRPAPRQDFRGQDNRGPDNRGDGGQNRQDRPDRYQGDRPRRDNRDFRNDQRDMRPDNQQGRNDYRDNRNDNRNDRGGEFRGDNRNAGQNRNERFNGERPRQDFRPGANDQGGEHYNGERARPDLRDGRTETTPEPYIADAAAAQEREFRDNAPAERVAAEPPAPIIESRDEAGFVPDAVQDEAAPRPRRRRAPRAAKPAAAEGSAGEPDPTRDGEAALAAFPE